MASESFGQRIRALRQAKNLSLREAASELRISHPYLVQLEQGLESPSEELSNRIAKFYAVDAAELLFLAKRVSETIEGFATTFPQQTADTLQSFRRDLFISHRSTDKPWVRELAAHLQKVNIRGRALRVWVDEAEIRPGQSITGEVNKALETSQYIALALTPDYFNSPSGWTDAEWQAALFTDPAGRQARVLPLLVKDCPYIPALLRHIGMIDFRDPGEFEKSVTKLVSVLAGDIPESIAARGQVIAPTGHIARTTLVAERSTHSGKPDVVEETLPCNLVPVVSLPEFLWMAPLATGIGSDKNEIKEHIHRYLIEGEQAVFTPVFTLHSGQVLSFFDLAAEEGPFCRVVAPSQARRVPVSTCVATPDTQRLVVSLLNTHIHRHCYSVGLVTAPTDDRRRFFFPAEAKAVDREFRWRRNARPRTVVKHYFEKDGELKFCRHLAAQLPIAFLGSRFYIRITPTWLFTGDGTPQSLLRGRRVGLLAVRWMGRERNLQILYHTRFWAYVLARGRSVINIRAGDQSMLADTQPACIKLSVGIREDHLNLEGLIYQLGDDFDWDEAQVLEELRGMENDEAAE